MLYIRHAKKIYNNNSSNQYCLDAPLTEEGRNDAKIKFQQLIEKYGIPDSIVTSPFLRNRETAKIAQDCILATKQQLVEIKYDPKIGEYLGNQKAKDIYQHLYQDTIDLNPIPVESLDQFRKRVIEHLREVKDKYTWYISHGFFIKLIAQQYNYYPGHIKELSGIYIKDQNLELI